MAAFSGKSGSVDCGSNWDTEVKSFTINIGQQALESTAFGDSWREFVVGLQDWSGSYTANLDTSTTLTWLTSAATATFTASSGRTYTGLIIVTGLNPAVNVDGVAEVTVNFQGTGALTPN